MATGVIHRLQRSGFQPICTEQAKPLAVRRTVALCEAVWNGRARVEGCVAELAADLDQAGAIQRTGRIPILVDPELKQLADLAPNVLIEATLAKRNSLPIKAGLADLVIALGPGFSAPEDAHWVIETNRGHNLGRVIDQGCTEADTGTPGNIGGFTHQRVLRAPVAGVFETDRAIGDLVETGQIIGMVVGSPVRAELNGMIRGLIRPGSTVSAGLKIGDIDPRGKGAFFNLISEKARAIGGSVLECILRKYNI